MRDVWQYTYICIIIDIIMYIIMYIMFSNYLIYMYDI